MMDRAFHFIGLDSTGKRKETVPHLSLVEGSVLTQMQKAKRLAGRRSATEASPTAPGTRKIHEDANKVTHLTAVEGSVLAQMQNAKRLAGRRSAAEDVP